MKKQEGKETGLYTCQDGCERAEVSTTEALATNVHLVFLERTQMQYKRASIRQEITGKYQVPHIPLPSKGSRTGTRTAF